MRETNWDRRFFESTRGRVLKLLCTARRTVSELAASLGLTDNAVRAHLAALGRDGLVRQSGVQRGTRRPNYAYELTDEGHQFFPKAHAPVLAELLDVLADRLPQRTVEEVLREVGLRLAREHLHGAGADSPQHRAERLLQLLASAGVVTDVERDDERVVVRGCSCPLSSVVTPHPELCRIAAGVLGEVLGRQVTERCERGESPRCCFEISPIPPAGPSGRGGKAART
jgi:predicted ArsR family transcriptional regulator